MSGTMAKHPGIYAIYNGDFLVYVGSSQNLRSRLYSYKLHTNPCHWLFSKVANPRFKYRHSLKFGEWLMTEARLIRRLQPPLNLRFKGRVRV